MTTFSDGAAARLTGIVLRGRRFSSIPLLAVALLGVACGARAALTPEALATPVTLIARGAPLHFVYETVDGKQLSPETLAGRVSVIAFIATYDVPSQAQAHFLASLVSHHAPRLNAALLALEPPENRPMVEAFASTLGLGFPVALADAATIAGEGPFAGLHHVPSIVVLDREGREAFRHLGLLNDAALETVVRAVERAGDGAR